jgi:hypothetical protein
MAEPAPQTDKSRWLNTGMLNRTGNDGKRFGFDIG